MEKIPFGKHFYDEDFNPALYYFKKIMTWIALNAPDVSMILGIKKFIINLLFIFSVSALTLYIFGSEGISFWGILQLFTIGGALATIFYSRSLAFAILKMLLLWESQLRKTFEEKETFK